MQVRKYLKGQNLNGDALLLLDNAPSHPDPSQLVSDDGRIIVMYMPPNVTALIHPMDQNVIRITKLFYRSSLLAMVVADPSKDISEQLKGVNLRVVVELLSQAWDQVSEDVISKCWKIILHDESFDPEDDIPLSVWRQSAINTIAEIHAQIQSISNAGLVIF